MKSMVSNLPLSQLHESPTNLRRSFGDMAELVESIRRVGVLQPLLARPLAGAESHYEIVFGHRRFRAAGEAGLKTVPVMLRELDDQQALEAQLMENCQRADVHPLDEADGYRRLHEDHGYTVEDLAAKLGKSRGYIYGRMKLCALSPRAREAFTGGSLSTAVALLVARLPVADLQDRAIAEITDGAYEPMSTKQVAEHLRGSYMLLLSEAPFGTADPELLPEAGPCTTCPHRTGNQPELFEDVDSTDVCTNPKCFGLKRDADWMRRTAAAEAKGQRVLKESEAKKLFPYAGRLTYGSPFVDLKDPCPGDVKGRSWSQVLGKKVSPEALARDELGGTHELVEAKAAVALLKEQRPELAEWNYPPSADRTPNADEVKRKQDEKIHRAAVQSAMAALVDAVTTAAAPPWDIVLHGLLLGEVLGVVCKRRGVDSEDDLSVGLSDAEQAALAVELVCTRNVYSSWGGKERTKTLELACKKYGVDWKAHVSRAKSELKKKPGKKKAA